MTSMYEIVDDLVFISNLLSHDILIFFLKNRTIDLHFFYENNFIRTSRPKIVKK